MVVQFFTQRYGHVKWKVHIIFGIGGELSYSRTWQIVSEMDHLVISQFWVLETIDERRTLSLQSLNMAVEFHQEIMHKYA